MRFHCVSFQAKKTPPFEEYAANSLRSSRAKKIMLLKRGFENESRRSLGGGSPFLVYFVKNGVWNSLNFHFKGIFFKRISLFSSCYTFEFNYKPHKRFFRNISQKNKNKIRAFLRRWPLFCCVRKYRPNDVSISKSSLLL